MRLISQEEEWRDILGFEEYYQISSLGRVKSKDRCVFDLNGNFLRRNKGRLMKAYPARYDNIGLNKNRNQKRENW